MKEKQTPHNQKCMPVDPNVGTDFKCWLFLYCYVLCRSLWFRGKEYLNYTGKCAGTAYSVVLEKQAELFV